MDVTAHFSGIHKVILNHLNQADEEINAAVAWFTDRELFDALCKRAAMGVSVHVALMDDDINKGPAGLNFIKLTSLGGRVTLVSPGSRGESLMHHKFCIIDAQTIITGSYNWSRRARSNDENITIITDAPDLAKQYLDAFWDLVGRRQGDAPPVDGEAVRRRLELIRNLILLDEHESLDTHLDRLRLVTDKLELEPILEFLDAGEFTKALESIEIYLQRATALVQADTMEVTRLRLELRVMELRLESVYEEKTELERRLVLFSRRYSEALGDLIRKVLAARAVLARLHAMHFAEDKDEEYERARDAADEAESRYREYREQQQSIQDLPPPRTLDADTERELKLLYRKACILCHPDKVAEPYKANAQAAFQELQQAYRANDLDGVRKIYEALKSGGTLPTRSKVLREVDALKAAVAEMERKIAAIVCEYNELRESEAVRLMESVGSDESSWESYVARRRAELQKELDDLKSEIVLFKEAQFR